MGQRVALGSDRSRTYSRKKGAQSAVYLAEENVQESGLYWADKKIRLHNPIADDNRFTKEFWEFSQSLLPE